MFMGGLIGDEPYIPSPRLSFLFFLLYLDRML